MDAAREQPERREPIGGPVEDASPLREGVLAKAKASPVRCPFCHADVRIDADPWVACRGCLARHHVACWQERAQCSACGTTTALREDLPARPGATRAVWVGVVAVLGLFLLSAGVLLGSARQVVDEPPPALKALSKEDSPRVRPIDASRPALSHVHVGQTYTYTLTTAGTPSMELDFRVQAISEGVVKYTTQVRMDMGQGLVPVGDPTPTEWKLEVPRDAMGRATENPWAGTTREKITVSGFEFDCVVFASGTATSWIPASGDMATFPPVVRSETDGKVTMELIRISR